MPGLLATTSVALESIQFQSGRFFKELTAIFASFSEVPKEKLLDTPVWTTVANCIRKHTGIIVSVIPESTGPAIQIPMMDKNHPLWPTPWENAVNSGDGVRLLQAAGGLVKGSVNLGTATVSGVFCDLGAVMYIPAEFVSNKDFSAEEKAAVCLHECGHYFVFCEYLGRTVTTNYVLSVLTRSLEQSQGPDERVAVIVAAKDALKLRTLQAKELAQEKNLATVQGIVISNALQQMRSELNSQGYDDIGFEYLSDEFATRQGAGRYLITALDKMHRKVFHRAYRPLPIYLMLELLKIALLLIPALQPIAVLLISIDNSHPMYDDPEARTRRVRNQIVEAMKDPQIPPAQFKALKEDLDAVDKILAVVVDRRQWFAVLFDSILPWRRRTRSQMLLQKELENLAHNDLFVKAQELKQLT